MKLLRSSHMLFVALFVLLPLACSKSSDVPLLSPPLSAQQTNRDSAGNPRHMLWGIWDISISDDGYFVDIKPLREADLHFNVVRLLEVSPCSTCLMIDKVTEIAPDLIDVDVTLRHPFPGLTKYTGFDVRGIFISESDYVFPPSGRSISWGNDIPQLINFDGYTSLFNPTEFPESLPVFPALKYTTGKWATGGDLSSTLNPFMAYRKDAPRRIFESGSKVARSCIDRDFICGELLLYTILHLDNLIPTFHLQRQHLPQKPPF